MADVARPSTNGSVQSVNVVLEEGATAAGQARALLRDAVTSWGLHHLVDDAALAVSELVTNAVSHGLPPVTLSLQRWPTTLRIEVSDMRPSTATHDLIVTSHVDDESGRGQGIVAAVCDSTGLADTPGEGKAVYASWDVGGR